MADRKTTENTDLQDRRAWTPPTVEELSIEETATGVKAGADSVFSQAS